MKDKNLKLVYSILGCIMLILLQTYPFKNSLGAINLLIKGPLGNIFMYISYVLSFSAVILFIVLSIKLIIINLKN